MEESQIINKEEEEEVRERKSSSYASAIWRWLQQVLRAILYKCFGYSTTPTSNITTPLIKNPTSNKKEDNSDTNPTHSSQPAADSPSATGEEDPPTDTDSALTARTIALSKEPPRPPISRGGGGKTN